MASQKRDVSALAAIPKNYESAVRALAAAHSEGLDEIEIYYIRDPQRQVVRLIEVSATFPEGGVERQSPRNGVERVVPVFPMGPASDFPFRSEVVQVTPGEWRQLLKNKLKLNREWGNLSRAERVPNGE